jgi:Fur family ferric uptake transcriptional regulator
MAREAPAGNVGSAVATNGETIEEVLALVRSHGGRATRLGSGAATYHLASAAHGPLLCETCGTMTEVPDALFIDLIRAAGTEYGFAINPHRFAVTGRCANCLAAAR